MARKPRFVARRQAHLLRQTGLDEVPLFREDKDFSGFLELLKNSAKVNDVAVHAYALLPTEVLLLVTPGEAESLSRFMQWIGRRYVPIYNAKYGRAGSLWRARFRAAIVDGKNELIPTSQFVEESPMRAGLCVQAADYPWSSCQAHTGAKRDAVLTDHPGYWALGNTPFDREMAYQRQLEQALTAAQVARFEGCLQSGWAIGSPEFASGLEAEAGRRLSPARRGRPPGKGAADSPKEGDMSPIIAPESVPDK